MIKENGERANKRFHREKRKTDFTWKNRWNNNDKIERIVYNQKILSKMKDQKIKALKGQLKSLKESLIEEKKRYSVKNKKIIKEASKDLYDFFLLEEKKMLSHYKEKIDKKNEEINNITDLEGKKLFDIFSVDEKINNIGLTKKGLSSLSTNINSGN